MLIPSIRLMLMGLRTSLSRRVNANSQRDYVQVAHMLKLIKKGEC
ncbi:hypothetical protein MCC10012_1583 [Bifidobacterium longum subsp. longum]|nr:hypothetical protein MCC10012_1583 [Bifidobacterium longum subsp. longum]